MHQQTTRPLLIIVGGAPATGKTTLGRRIATDLHLPFIGKDDIKETLFDTLGIGDRAWSRQLGGATYPLMYFMVETLLKVGISTVVESNFDPIASTQEFLALKQRYSFASFQILCQAPRAVTLERYRKRWERGERHPGHVDDAASADVARDFGKFRHLDIGGTAITVDTSDWSRINYDEIEATIRDAHIAACEL